MSTELFDLAVVTALTALMWVPYMVDATLVRGVWAVLDNPKEDAPKLARTFADLIDKYGRSFELGLASRYYLTRKPGSLMRMGPLGMLLFTHGRMALRPKRIRNMAQLNAILNRARQLRGAA